MKSESRILRAKGSLFRCNRILFEYPDYQVKIEWNGSATFNVFNGGKNVNCFTDYSAKTMEQAQVIADEWLEEQVEEEKRNNY